MRGLGRLSGIRALASTSDILSVGFARSTRRRFGICSFRFCFCRSFRSAAAVCLLIIIHIEAGTLEHNARTEAYLPGGIHRLAFGANNLRLFVHAMEFFKQATAIRAFVIIRWHTCNI